MKKNWKRKKKKNIMYILNPNTQMGRTVKINVVKKKQKEGGTKVTKKKRVKSIDDEDHEEQK